MIRRYDVKLGVPSSVTARMTCAMPGVLGITVAAGDVSPCVTVTRGLGVGRPPTGAGGMALTNAVPLGLPPAAEAGAGCVVGADGPVCAGGLAGVPLPAAEGMPVAASG